MMHPSRLVPVNPALAGLTWLGSLDPTRVAVA